MPAIRTQIREALQQRIAAHVLCEVRLHRETPVLLEGVTQLVTIEWGAPGKILEIVGGILYTMPAVIRGYVGDVSTAEAIAAAEHLELGCNAAVYSGNRQLDGLAQDVRESELGADADTLDLESGDPACAFALPIEIDFWTIPGDPTRRGGASL